MEETTGAHNKKYFDRWRNLLMNFRFADYYRYMARRNESGFTSYGYSLVKDMGLSSEVIRGIGKTSSLLGGSYCYAANASAFFQRSASWSKSFVRQRVRAFLPEFALARIRQARQRRIDRKASVVLPQT